MSYIHEALKKAQKDQDSYSRQYGGTVSAQSRDRRFSINGKILLGLLVLPCLLLVYAFYYRIDDNEPPIALVSTYEKSVPPSNIEQKPVRDAGVFYDKARLHHKSGDLDEAKRLYKETIMIEPDHIHAINNLAVIYIHQKDYERAIQGFEEAIRFGPRYVDPYYNLACIFALKGKLSESLAHLRKAVMIDRSVAEWARRDPDLDNIRKTPEFDEIMKIGTG
ncbi:MAG: tetratricopeptide repeat protein [Desulfatiglans sp.]|jgi:tetratricopeptide (TPR) repeat protein|nr:tetratricopeptide repeat protein [Thermodesulfobacteriota bacterium]MEE4352895.1 tetratricopeptide repeat protein [Desulfatiglans sp.]